MAFGGGVEDTADKMLAHVHDSIQGSTDLKLEDIIKLEFVAYAPGPPNKLTASQNALKRLARYTLLNWDLDLLRATPSEYTKLQPMAKVAFPNAVSGRLEIDHVLPQSKKKDHSWGNLTMSRLNGETLDKEWPARVQVYRGVGHIGQPDLVTASELELLKTHTDGDGAATSDWGESDIKLRCERIGKFIVRRWGLGQEQAKETGSGQQEATVLAGAPPALESKGSGRKNAMMKGAFRATGQIPPASAPMETDAATTVLAGTDTERQPDAPTGSGAVAALLPFKWDERLTKVLVNAYRDQPKDHRDWRAIAADVNKEVEPTMTPAEKDQCRHRVESKDASRMIEVANAEAARKAEAAAKEQRQAARVTWSPPMVEALERAVGAQTSSSRSRVDWHTVAEEVKKELGQSEMSLEAVHCSRKWSALKKRKAREGRETTETKKQRTT